MEIIDPPVGPYSTAAELRDWEAELLAMAPSDAVSEALAQVRRWLAAQAEAKG